MSSSQSAGSTSFGAATNPTFRWVVVDLDTLPVEEPYRPETSRWAKRVNWRRVNRVAIQLLEADLLNDYRAVARASRWRLRRNRLAIDSLVSWPIDANSAQITSGIHRISAMRARGLRFTIGIEPVD